MKILVNTPDTTRYGGVSNFYRTLKDHLDHTADYFIIGGLCKCGKTNRRSHESCLASSLIG